MNWLTATVVTRPRDTRQGSTEPAISTWAMIQPPKMSPLAFASEGIGMMRSTSSRCPMAEMAGLTELLVIVLQSILS